MGSFVKLFESVNQSMPRMFSYYIQYFSVPRTKLEEGAINEVLGLLLPQCAWKPNTYILYLFIQFDNHVSRTPLSMSNSGRGYASRGRLLNWSNGSENAQNKGMNSKWIWMPRGPDFDYFYIYRMSPAPKEPHKLLFYVKSTQWNRGTKIPGVV
jgi:hypothetical protein